ncbi:MAG: DUF3391 domain-containing protein [Nitrospirae bacterium]|nr:DUF3391 domain-containing protein [Nitrospirota bacterium]
MQKKISINQLEPGMYIDGVDKSWLETDLFSHHFKVKDASHIEKLKRLGIKHVVIDTVKGRDLPKDKGITRDVSAGKDNKESAAAAPAKPAESTIIKPAEPKVDLYTPEEMKRYCETIDSFSQIEKEALIKGSFINFSIFLKKHLNIAMLTEYKNKDIEITDDILSTDGELLIDRNDTHKYTRYIKDLIFSKILDSDVNVKHLKGLLIRENSKLIVRELFDDPRSGETIHKTRGSVEEIVGSIQDNKQITTSLLTINKHDYYTYTHSVNVCVLSIGLAIALEMFNEKEINNIGIGSLLHDIGKSAIPIEILNKPTLLTEKEFSIMKQHVTFGKKILSFHDAMPKDAYHPILEHHERLTGDGYPSSLTGQELHTSGKIAAIVDTYDALTTARPYKDALSSFESLSMIKGQVNNYDSEIVKKFILMLGSIR